MSRMNVLTHLFNTGEVSRAALNRVDKEAMRLYAEQQQNILPYTIGKAKMRPGTRHIGTTAGLPRLISFYKSTAARAILELTDAKLRVWVGDALVTREAVDSTITNGDFGSATGWTTTSTGGATANIADGKLTLDAPFRGSQAMCKQEVTTGNLGEEHAVRVVVERGPVSFKIGSAENNGEYLAETTLDTGIHSLAFTPTGAQGGTDAYTVLLLHCDGSNGSTTFTDSSPMAHTVTAQGTDLSTAQQKFGTASIFFDGFLDYVELDGSNDFEFGTGDFTVDFWIRPTVAPANVAFYDSRPAGDANEPALFIGAQGTGQLQIYVNGTTVFIGTTVISTGAWYHVAVSRSSGVMYVFLNGVLEGTPFAMTVNLENNPLRPALGANGDNVFSGSYTGYMDELRVSKGIARWTSSFSPPSSAYGGAGDTYWVQFTSRLDRDIIVSDVQIEGDGIMEIGAPWSTDELRDIAYDQSGDVIFMACGSWQQRKIERRGNSSWSVTLYQPDDGPFMISRSANVRLTPGATRGNTTLTSDAPFFRSSHVGALFQLNHDKFKGNFGLAGADRYTDAIQVQGIGTDNDFIVTRSSTWIGTLRLYRSVDSREVGFVDTGTNYTTTGASSFAPGTEFDNIIQYYRVGFGTTDYTSGTAIVEFDYGGDSGFGVCRVTEYVSETQVLVEVLSDFKHTSATDNWLEGEWSDRRGWPTAVGFFDGRLWWMGSDRFWGSESNNFYTFTLETEGDSGSIQRSLATGGAFFQGSWILGLQRLIFGTDGAEISARSSSFDEPLTPTNITLKPASTNGCANVAPVRLDSRGIYVDSSRMKIYELAYSVDANDYVSNDLTRVHEELADPLNPELYEAAFVEVSVQRKPETYVWALRDDGVAIALLLNAGDEVRGFNKIMTGANNGLDDTLPCDRFLSIAPQRTAGEDDVYVAVERTILVDDVVSQVYYIEKFAKHSETLTKTFDASIQDVAVNSGLYIADCSSTFEGTGAVGQVITGLERFEGRSVIFIGQTVDQHFGPATEDGTSKSTVAQVVVEDGSVTVPQRMLGTCVVGLPYDGRYISGKLVVGAQKGAGLTMDKKFDMVGIAMLDTHYDALRVGRKFDTENEMDELPPEPLLADELDPTGKLFRSLDANPFPFPGEWGTDGRVHLLIRPGWSATLSALVTGMTMTES